MRTKIEVTMLAFWCNLTAIQQARADAPANLRVLETHARASFSHPDLNTNERLFGWIRGSLGDINSNGIVEYGYGSRF